MTPSPPELLGFWLSASPSMWVTRGSGSPDSVVLTAARHQHIIARDVPPDVFDVPPWPYGVATEYLPPEGGVPPVEGFSKALVLSGSSFRMALPHPTNLVGAEVWLRAAVMPRQVRGVWYDNTRPWAFELGVEDSPGRIYWTSSDAVGGIRPAHAPDPPPPPGSPYRRRAVMKTLRFPVSCFAPAEPKGRSFKGVTLTAIVAVHLRNQDKRGHIGLDDLQVVRPAELAGVVLAGFPREVHPK